jgi:glycerophosphoryl diester phosphodiesterase
MTRGSRPLDPSSEAPPREAPWSVASLGLPARPWIVGHRGACGEEPENTVEGFFRAIQDGAHMVELDLQLTSDGRLVAAHDGTLRRVARQRLRIEESTFAELRQANVAAQFPRSPAARIPALEEVLETLPHDYPLNLELKCRRVSRERFARILGKAIRRRARLLLSSFDFRLLAEVRHALPDRPLAPIGRRGRPGLLRAARRLRAASVHVRSEAASRRLVRSAGETGMPVLCYTVNRTTTARRLFRLGVAGIFTDFPGRFTGGG